MITVKAIALWLDRPEEQVIRYVPRRFIKNGSLTLRQALVVAVAVVLDVSYSSAEGFYHRWLRSKRKCVERKKSCRSYELTF